MYVHTQLCAAMVLEILEEEIREVIFDLFTRTENGTLQDKESALLAEHLEFCAPVNTQLSIVDAVMRKQFHVHIADFIDCVTGNSAAALIID